MGNNKWLKAGVIISVFVLAVTIITLVFVRWQLGVMNKTLDSQLDESKKMGELLNETLSESRKTNFDKHTFGAVYVWDFKPIDENKKIWTENLTVLFSNNFPFYALNDLTFNIQFPNGSYFTNITVYPRLGVEIHNVTVEPPHNETRIIWDSINVGTNTTATFMVRWSYELLPRTNITPIKNEISTTVRGEDYSIINLPIIYAKPPQ